MEDLKGTRDYKERDKEEGKDEGLELDVWDRGIPN